MTDTDALQAELRGLLGTQISGRYRIDALIGVGGMGAVFRARHMLLDRDVAIKVLHPELTKDSEIAARFDREARSASRLDHPNCLQVTDSGTIDESGGAKFLVMQLLEGEELSARLGAPLPPLEAIEYMLQILRGLEHAHEQGVVHRDLKPENVFVTKDHEGKDVLKIVDFGIAKIVSGNDSNDTMTQMGIVFGTPQYMSPEQATGMDIDARTDLYSAGVIFYEMLTGHPPFEADDPVALVRMQVTQEPEPLPTDLPESLRAFVHRLLAKQRDERFSSAREARTALEAIRDEIALAEGVPVPGSVAASVAIPVAAAPARSALRPLAAGAAAMAGLGMLVWALLATPNQSSKSDEKTAKSYPNPTGIEPRSAEDDGKADTEDGRKARLAEIDRLLMGDADDRAAAEKLIESLLDEHPEDPLLLWRQGRFLAEEKRKGVEALASYGDAIDHDPSLLDDKEFYAELMKLMQRRGLEKQALDLAVRKMGKHGHGFLVKLVNRKKKALGYEDRHRALDELATDPANEALVDVEYNVALDLWQAKDSLAPCRNYAAALDYVEAHPDPYFLGALRKAPLPEPPEEGKADPKEAEICAGLAARRDALVERIERIAGEAGDGADAGAAGSKEKATTGRASAKGGKKASRKKATSKQGGKTKKGKPAKCRRFGAALVYPECR